MFKRNVKLGSLCGVLAAILLVGAIKHEPITGILAVCGVLVLYFCLRIMSMLWVTMFLTTSWEDA